VDAGPAQSQERLRVGIRDAEFVHAGPGRESFVSCQRARDSPTSGGRVLIQMYAVIGGVRCVEGAALETAPPNTGSASAAAHR
jgi:hypothetical protein